MGEASEKPGKYEESMLTFTIQAMGPGLELKLIHATAYTQLSFSAR